MCARWTSWSDPDSTVRLLFTQSQTSRPGRTLRLGGVPLHSRGRGVQSEERRVPTLPAPQREKARKWSLVASLTGNETQTFVVTKRASCSRREPPLPAPSDSTSGLPHCEAARLGDCRASPRTAPLARQCHAVALVGGEHPSDERITLCPRWSITTSVANRYGEPLWRSSQKAGPGCSPCAVWPNASAAP